MAPPNEELPFDVKKKLMRFNRDDLEFLERRTKNSSAFIRELVSRMVKKMKERDDDGKQFDWNE